MNQVYSTFLWFALSFVIKRGIILPQEASWHRCRPMLLSFRRQLNVDLWFHRIRNRRARQFNNVNESQLINAAEFIFCFILLSSAGREALLIVFWLIKLICIIINQAPEVELYKLTCGQRGDAPTCRVNLSFNVGGREQVNEAENFPFPLSLVSRFINWYTTD